MILPYDANPGRMEFSERTGLFVCTIRHLHLNGSVVKMSVAVAIENRLRKARWGLFGFGQKAIKGEIGYFGLEEWWLSAFSDDERRHIQDRYQPLGATANTLTSGDISYTSQTVVGFLCTLASWFSREDDRAIGHKILAKAEELADDSTPILDRHFMYQTKLELHYKDRDKPGHLEKAVVACLQQIELAPQAREAFKAEYSAFGNAPLPSHKGYRQLAIVLEKQMKFREAIGVCAQAEKQGWAGDWQHRIERCGKKLAKKRA